jgi:hypothetical protein
MLQDADKILCEGREEDFFEGKQKLLFEKSALVFVASEIPKTKTHRSSSALNSNAAFKISVRFDMEEFSTRLFAMPNRSSKFLLKDRLDVCRWRRS